MKPLVAWAPQPGPQQALITCPIEDTLYGGARGGGKTDGLIGDAHIRAMRYGKKFRGVLFRKTYTPELEEVIARTRDLLPKLGWHYNQTAHEWTHGNGATLLLRYLETLADADNYQGHQYCWQGFDEVGNWPESAPIDKMWGSLRSPYGVPCVRRLTANPGGPGHHWVKERYRIPDHIDFTKLHLDPFKYQPQPKHAPHLWINAVFIPARLEDNAILMSGDPGYESRLAAAGGEALYRAWRFGDWSAVVGAAFPEWRPDLHILERFRVPKGWALAGGCDWGYRAPGWFGLFACGPDEDVVCVKELSFREQTDHQVGYAVGLICREWGVVTHIAGDEQMWYKTGVGAPTIAEGFQTGLMEAIPDLDYVPKLIPSSHGRGSRAAKLVVMHQYLAWKAAPDGTVPQWGRPRLRFLRDGCPVAITTIPALPVDPKNPEDVDTTANDHPYDGATAFLMSRPPIGVAAVRPEPADQHPGFDRNTRRRAKPAWERALRSQVETVDDHFRVPRNVVPIDELE